MRTPRSLKKSQIPASNRVIHIALIAVTLVSFLGQDWIQWKKGKSPFIFSRHIPEKEQAVPIRKSPSRIVLETLAGLGIGGESINRFKDDDGTHHLMIDIPFQKFSKLEKNLENALFQTGFRIYKREEQKTAEKNFYLWDVEIRQGQRLAVLFSCQKAVKAVGVNPAVKKARNKVALIVDDMGYSLETLHQLVSIKEPVTVAVIPYSPLALETATISRRNGLEVMLHLPLESINNKEYHNIKGMIYAGMSEEDIIETVDQDLAQVPFIQGVNNHMGSRITANTRLMRIILGRLKARNLFFIDSRTTGGSVAHQVAQNLGIPTAFRHVFLDGEPREEYIKSKFMELLRVARKKGFALGICHPLTETLKVLKENFHLIEAHGLEPVFASQIVR